jgi:hypothetical protein
MTFATKVGVALFALLCASTLQAEAASASAVHAADVQTQTDPSGNVYDSNTGAVVTDQPAANVETATASDADGEVGLTLSVYGTNPDPDTDPGWSENTPADTQSEVGWEIVTSNDSTYLATFANHLTSPTSGIAGALSYDDDGTGVPISCVVTPTYSATAGYGVAFASSCIGNPAAYSWNAFIGYHPATYPMDETVGKVAPEQGPFPKALTYGPTVNGGPLVSASGSSKMSSGYWSFAADGGVFSHGSAHFYGSTGNIHLNQPIVGSDPTSDSAGYWLVASDGGVFTFGDARFYGSTGGMNLNEPIVGMASTPDGGGYWLVASDGGVFAFGDAAFYGSTGDMKLNKPIVGIASTADGKGYWLVASDGGIFSFGDATFHGSTGALKLNQPIVGMAATPTGGGYDLVASDGGIFTFGDAKFLGSTGSLTLNKPIVGMSLTADGDGYWLVASDGGIFSYGDATFYGSEGGTKLNQPIVTIAGAAS